jgi:hypothetical protein
MLFLWNARPFYGWHVLADNDNRFDKVKDAGLVSWTVQRETTVSDCHH